MSHETATVMLSGSGLTIEPVAAVRHRESFIRISGEADVRTRVEAALTLVVEPAFNRGLPACFRMLGHYEARISLSEPTRRCGHARGCRLERFPS